MTDVYWLEQTEDNVPAENDWLGPSEVCRMNELRFAKRRADWRLGRWTAKRALAFCLGLPWDPRFLAKIEIRAASSGAPEVLVRDQQTVVSVSLSHRSRRAVCVVARSVVALGCDVEEVEPRSEAFVADYFAAEEQELIAQSREAERSLAVALLWSAKESALKALHEGLRLDTRSVVVKPGEMSSPLCGWHSLEVQHTDGQIFSGWWRRADQFLWTIVAAPPPKEPIPLQLPPLFNSVLAQLGYGDEQNSSEATQVRREIDT
jgi:4'-phosphopantetheinyl transferase